MALQTMKKFLLFYFVLSSLLLTAQSQSDSLIRTLDRLGIEDILLGDSLATTQVAAASRSLQNISELPFTIYVIRREEILSNGYITLADALKSMPGIRVSQPGSALEGETFIMRGLLGNTYAKILINGNSIKPYVVSGMPIGAQLPIQQAERIEVIYGPAAALYGADASSGIINIVLAESERPIFTKASLHVGSDSYKSMHLLFGGKTGRGDNVIRFKLYGMDTRFDDRRIFYNTSELYDPLIYTNRIFDSIAVFNDMNYRNGIAQNTPHESRSVGVEVQYRFLTFSATNMNRRDHSSIGYNPSAVSYANPLISTGEAITSANVKSAFMLNSIRFETKFEVLRYNLEDRSSNLYVHPILNALLYNAIPDSLDRMTIRSDIEEGYFSNVRFMRATSSEYSLEQTLNTPIFSNGDFTIGLKYLIGTGSALRDYQRNVFNANQANLPNLAPAVTDQNIEEYSFFVQLFKPLGKNFNLLVAGQYLKRNNGDFAASLSTFNPRLALLYKNSEQLQFRASYSTAIRTPSPYFSATTYTVEPENFSSLITGNANLEEESTKAYELGMRWEISKFVDLDCSVSYTRTDGFINYNLTVQGLNQGGPLSGFTLGYFNDENSRAELLDFQTYIRFRNIIPAIKLGGNFGINIADGEETLTTTNISTFENQTRVLDDLRSHPKFLSRLSLHASPVKDVLIRVDQLLVSQTLTRNSFRLNAEDIPNNPLNMNLYNDAYYTMDIALNYQINKNFLLYVKFMNVFNTGYAGIDASSSNDILLYNPQSLFTFHFGLNYELN